MGAPGSGTGSSSGSRLDLPTIGRGGEGVGGPAAGDEGEGFSGGVAPRTTAVIMEEATIFEVVDRESVQARMALPPRYRFRDLLLGDFAFNDDGER